MNKCPRNEKYLNILAMKLIKNTSCGQNYYHTLEDYLKDFPNAEHWKPYLSRYQTNLLKAEHEGAFMFRW